MISRFCLLCAILSGCVLTAAAAAPVGDTTQARIVFPYCLVSLIERDGDVEVPAQEAGVLQGLEVREGSAIEVGAMIGQLDDNLPQMKKKVADAEYKVAQAEAENDVDIRFNDKARRVKYHEYLLNKQANDQVEKTKAVTELERLYLEYEKAQLGWEQAKVKQGMDKLKAEAKAAEVEAADNDIHRRKLLAPISGEVIEINAGVGEWLHAGAPVVRIAKMDRLRVEGWLEVKEFAPSQVNGRGVVVASEVGPSRVEEFQGKVVFIDPLVTKGKYRVMAEVVNRRDAGDGPWLLRPGMQPESMTIDALPSNRPNAAAQRAPAPQR